jgi:hypothetical protein
MNRFYFLSILIFLLFSSCLVKSAIDQSPGVLGSCGHITLKCDRNIAVKILDSISKLDLFKVSEKYEEYNDWDERGFDFLTYWTISGKDNLYWISISNENEQDATISVRSIFNKKKKKWTHVKKTTNKKIEEAENFMKWFSKKLKPCI